MLDGSRGEPQTTGSGRTVARLAAAFATGLVVANCAGGPNPSGRHASELKYGVRSSPRVVAEGEPVPKGGGREMIGSPYVVAGRTYTPHPGRGYAREGWASWYGSAFHGRLTANGEVFDRQSIAAAHPTLPLPSYVRVTNVASGRSMVVRVNDRGPYERDRVIDVSERAADALGFRRHGTVRVRVEYLGKASLSGSDDDKLAATLRTDGRPASLDAYNRPVEVARVEPAPERSSAARIASASRPGRELPDDDEDEPAARVASTGPRPAAARDAIEDRRTIRPPSRPDLAGVY